MDALLCAVCGELITIDEAETSVKGLVCTACKEDVDDK
jgi:formylmethanofuran dehydrogenase subunit E